MPGKDGAGDSQRTPPYGGHFIDVGGKQAFNLIARNHQRHLSVVAKMIANLDSNSAARAGNSAADIDLDSPVTHEASAASTTASFARMDRGSLLRIANAAATPENNFIQPSDIDPRIDRTIFIAHRIDIFKRIQEEDIVDGQSDVDSMAAVASVSSESDNEGDMQLADFLRMLEPSDASDATEAASLGEQVDEPAAASVAVARDLDDQFLLAREAQGPIAAAEAIAEYSEVSTNIANSNSPNLSGATTTARACAANRDDEDVASGIDDSATEPGDVAEDDRIFLARASGLHADEVNLTLTGTTSAVGAATGGSELAGYGLTGADDGDSLLIEALAATSDTQHSEFYSALELDERRSEVEISGCCCSCVCQ